MRTTCFPSSNGGGGGGLLNPPIHSPLPYGCRHPYPLDADPLPLDADFPPPGHVTCDACWEANPLPCRQTNTCEKITLPQTWFAGGKNSLYNVIHEELS